MPKSTIKQLIRMCYESNLDLSAFLRAYIKQLRTDKETYNGK